MKNNQLRKTKTVLLITTILASIICLYNINISAYPNDLSINDDNNTDPLDSNINGTTYIVVYGNGSYASGVSIDILLDTDEIYFILLPSLNYGKTTITIIPDWAFEHLIFSENTEITYDSLLGLDVEIIHLDNSTYDFFSDVAVNISSIDYLTSFNNNFDIINASGTVLSGNQYPLPFMTSDGNVSMDDFQDDDISSSGAWAEARAFKEYNSFDITYTETNIPTIFALNFTINITSLNQRSFWINWSDSMYAQSYSLYTYDKPITEINGSLIEIDSGLTNNSYYFDNLFDDFYYYTVIALNDEGDMNSNCLGINVSSDIGNENVSLYYNDTVQNDRSFWLNWTDSFNADSYYLYMYDTPITEFNSSLILIEEGLINNSYYMKDILNDEYYFIAVAKNQFNNLTSNCIGVNLTVDGIDLLSDYELSFDYTTTTEANAEIMIEIAIEIVNDVIGNLNYQEYWDLIMQYYNMTLEAITSNGELIIGNYCEFNATLMYQTSDGQNHSFVFDSIQKANNITVEDILGNYSKHFGNVFFNYDNRTIPSNYINQMEGIEVIEEMFSNYSKARWGDNYGDIVTPHNNPVLTFRFWANASGFTNWTGNEYLYPEEMGRVGWRANGTCWAKLKFTEMDAKYHFRWNSTQNNGNGIYNNVMDVVVFAFDDLTSSYQVYSLNNSGYDTVLKGWENRVYMDDFDGSGEIANQTGIGVDYSGIYEDMNVTLNSVDVKCYHNTSIRISKIKIGDTELNDWTLWDASINTLDLTSEDFFTENGSYNSWIELDVSAFDFALGSDAYNDGLLYHMEIDYFEISQDFNSTYIESYGELIFNTTDFGRNISIDWNNMTFFGNYIKALDIDYSSQSIISTFQFYNSSDVAIYETFANISKSWDKGNSYEEILFEYYLDGTAPVITDHEIINTIEETEYTTYEFNVTGYDSEGLEYVFLILEDTSTWERTSYIMPHKSGNVYYRMFSYYDLPIGTYNVWYGLQDEASNFVTTPSFVLTVDTILPYPFTFFTINATDPDTDGFFILNWTNGGNTDNFSLYQSNNPITDINAPSIIVLGEGMTTTFSKMRSGLSDGIYYFLLIAYNENGNRSLQLSVNVQNTPKSFSLSIDGGDPDKDGKFILDWSESLYADNYSIYFSTMPMDDYTDGELLFSGIENTSKELEDYDDGTYYFIILAINELGQIESNQATITIELKGEEPEPEPVDDSWIIWIWIGVGIGALVGLSGFLVYANNKGMIKLGRMGIKPKKD